MDFELGIAELFDTVSELNNLISSMSEQRENVANALTELYDDWSGEAKDKFEEKHKENEAIYKNLEEDIKYLRECLDLEEKTTAIRLKKRCEDFVNCITRKGDATFTSDDSGKISLQYGGQYKIKKNIDDCISNYDKMNNNLEEIIQIANSLKFTSFGMYDYVSTIQNSIKNQTTSLTDFEDSFNIYYQGIQVMESNICSKLSKISTAVNKPSIISLEEAIQCAKATQVNNKAEYQVDIDKMRSSTNFWDRSQYFLDYVWDRYVGQYTLYNQQVGIADGMDPTWAKLYGDFSSGMLLENSTAVTVNGIRGYKAFITGEDIYSGNIVAGSGFGNTIISKKAMEHIFHGNINGKGMPSGYHKPSIMSKATISNVSSPDKFGVYKATIEINGKTKFSTFFPDAWNRVDVLNAIKEAKQGITFNKSGWYTGKTSSGMEIKMWLNSNGLTDTAFPIYSK